MALVSHLEHAAVTSEGKQAGARRHNMQLRPVYIQGHQHLIGPGSQACSMPLTARCAARFSAFICSCTCCSRRSSVSCAWCCMLRYTLPASTTEAAAMTPASVGPRPQLCRQQGPYKQASVSYVCRKWARYARACLAGRCSTSMQVAAICVSSTRML